MNYLEMTMRGGKLGALRDVELVQCGAMRETKRLNLRVMLVVLDAVQWCGHAGLMVWS